MKVIYDPAMSLKWRRTQIKGVAADHCLCLDIDRRTPPINQRFETVFFFCQNSRRVSAPSDVGKILEVQSPQMRTSK